MPDKATPDTPASQHPPWYRQFWPWFIIALPVSAVIASMILLYLAITRPDYMVVEDDELRRLNSGLKAQVTTPAKNQRVVDETDAGKHDPDHN
jgi:hypothetical protein